MSTIASFAALFFLLASVSVSVSADVLTHTGSAPTAVDLNTASTYAILSEAAITNTGTLTSVVGDIGTTLAVAGFTIYDDPTNPGNVISDLVTGNVYQHLAANSLAVTDMNNAYDYAAGLLGATAVVGNAIGGLTIEPGLYNWGAAVELSGNITFSGGENDIWILQLEGALTTTLNSNVVLVGGAKAENIYWQISAAATVGESSHLEGIFLLNGAMTLTQSSSLNGAVLAKAAVTMTATAIEKISTDTIRSRDRKFLRAY